MKLRVLSAAGQEMAEASLDHDALRNTLSMNARQTSLGVHTSRIGNAAVASSSPNTNRRYR